MNHTHLTGTWRSYKAFCANGSVRKYSATSYLELIREAQGGLILRPHADRSLLSETPAHQWEIRADGKRFYF